MSTPVTIGSARRPSRPNGSGPRAVACNAPSASLYLDQHGDVRACCQNSDHTLGNVTRESLLDIWHGERASRLRTAVSAGDLSLGCGFCRWQSEQGNDALVFARTFDHLTPESLHPQWPQQLELSLSNACNLQCVMCNGEWSSSIRIHREGLPPLPTAYDEAFFEDLAAFLPHLEVVKFLGGEPFLGAEPLRVLEMLAELGTDVAVQITTNGTQWSPRVERVLDRLRAAVVVSLDGVTPATYESIRVGASFDAVVTNIDRFVDLSRRKGTAFSLAHCLMTSNWHEFDAFLEFAEQRDAAVYVNTVTDPYGVSLYHLHPAELRSVVEALHARDGAVAARLSGSRATAWKQQVGRLDRHLASLERFDPPAYVASRRKLGFAWLAPTATGDGVEQRFRAMVDSAPGTVITVDADGRVESIDAAGAVPQRLAAMLDALVVVGRPLPADLRDQWGSGDHSVAFDDLHVCSVDLDDGDQFQVTVVRHACRDGAGVMSGAQILVREGAADPHPAAVVGVEDHPPSAYALAKAASDDPGEVAGFVVDRHGRLMPREGHRLELFGIDLQQYAGRRGQDLLEGLTGELGDLELRDEKAPDVGRVEHFVSVYRGARGRVVLHSFVEPLDEGCLVWVARQRDATPAAS